VRTGLGEGPVQSLSHNLNLTLQAYVQPTDVHPVAHPLPLTASIRLQRVNSAAGDQYYNDYQLQVWSYSSCSGIAMEMVMNAYGRHLIAADVLQVEQKLGVWDVQLGLLREEGIAMTAATFGFDTDASHTRTVQDLVTIANQGSPIIVGVRDNFYFPGGHILVVRGGDSQYVYLADSSPGNFQRMSYAMFQGMWQGFSAILKPRA
jgi:ABC-type bacteriocin/lantibiotic exporter with double-glycine peptidase domain